MRLFRIRAELVCGRPPPYSILELARYQFIAGVGCFGYTHTTYIIFLRFFWYMCNGIVVNGIYIYIFLMTHLIANVTSTGYYNPTSGTAYVNGCDLVHDLMGVRASIGYCAQNPVFYRYLTVENHLRLFGMV